MTLKRSIAVLGIAAAIGTVAAAAVFAASPPPSKGNDIVSSYGALARGRTSNDALPAAISRGIAAMNAQPPAVDDSLYEGRELGAESRLLLRGVGHNRLDIYAYPTSKGRVCFTTSRGGGGCVDREHQFTWGAFVPGASSPDQTLQLIGLVPNDVTSVTVVRDGKAAAATVANNAFFWESPYLGTTPDKLIVGHRDGRADTVAIPTLAP